MAENAAPREIDPEAFYKKCNEWTLSDYNKKNLRAALSHMPGYHFEALITLAWEQIQAGKRTAGADVDAALDYKPKLGPERQARSLAEEGLQRHAQFPLARIDAGQHERRFFQTTLAKALVRFANERQKHNEKSEVGVKEEKRPSEEPGRDMGAEDTDTIDTPRKRHQREDLRLLSSPSSERGLWAPQLHFSRPHQTMAPQTLIRFPQQVSFLLVARALNGAHIFRLQMRHVFGKDNPTTEDVTLEQITKEVEVSGFEAPKQKEVVRYVYVRKTGENDPVYNDRTLQASFLEFLMHEVGATQFTLFIEDRDGDPIGLPALERPT